MLFKAQSPPALHHKSRFYRRWAVASVCGPCGSREVLAAAHGQLPGSRSIIALGMRSAWVPLLADIEPRLVVAGLSRLSCGGRR